jgi:hypothetical protein
MPSAFMARTLAASIEAGRPLELTLRRKRVPSVVRYAITLHLDRCRTRSHGLCHDRCKPCLHKPCKRLTLESRVRALRPSVAPC